MSVDERTDGQGRRPRLLLVIAAVAVFALLLLAACGSDDDSGGGGGTDTAAEEAGENASEEGGAEGGAAEVSPEELQETVNTALETESITADSLPTLMKEALERATPEPDAKTMETAFECWQKNSCSVGDGDITLALADGFGDNTWRQFSKMNMILQALTYPEVGELVFTNAHGDLATFQADLRNLTAQGVDGIAVYNDFGPAAYSAMQAAQREGAVISSYVGTNDDATQAAITTRVQPDVCEVGKEMAKAVKSAIGATGPVAYFEGTPGNPQDQGWQKCATEAGIESIYTGTTEWTPAGAQKAASALVASGKPVKAILYSYSNPVPSIVDVYLKANKEIPAIITWTQNNETTCQWLEHPYELYQTNALNWAARVSVTAIMTKVEGGEPDEAVIYPMPYEPAKKSSCDKSKPAEYPGPSALVPEDLSDKMLAGQ